MRHTIVTMTRGDGGRIAEWVTYHAALGFEDFQIVLDGDVDGTADVLRSLDGPWSLTLHPRPEIEEYYDGLPVAERMVRINAWREHRAADPGVNPQRQIDPIAWRQYHHLPEVLAPYAAGERGRGWLALIDVDEFIVLAGHDAIADLTAEATEPRLRFLNFNVDTSDHDPARPVLEQHTWRWSREDLWSYPDQRWQRRCKSIVRYRAATLGSTVHKISGGRHVKLDPDVARLHHFKMPPGTGPAIPFSVDDPVLDHLPAARRPWRRTR